MLSDALCHARSDIGRYLADDCDVYRVWYGNPGYPLYDRVFRLLVEMCSIQWELDASPVGPHTPWERLRYDQQVEYVKQELANLKKLADLKKLVDLMKRMDAEKSDLLET